MFWWKASRVSLFLALPLAAGLPPQDPAVFHSGTRLVEVEVVVRNQRVRTPGLGAWLAWTFDSGPPWGPPGDVLKGLTKDDFTLLDNGKPQEIAVFRAGASNEAKPMVLPPGAVSNRQDSRGNPLNDATIVLIDLLNTPWIMTEYARLGVKNLVGSLTDTAGRVALYSLGKSLHVLHDFNDDPQKLREAAANFDQPHGKLPPDFTNALRDYGDPPTAFVDPVANQHGRITLQALKQIVRRLSGVPGRKNLVWLMPGPYVPPAIMAMLQQANIVLYPVPLRCQNWDCQDAARHLAAATGGRAFFDSLDLAFAVQASEEDPRAAYVLGFYPTEDMLDGKYHNITVNLANHAPSKQPAEMDYRTGYLATKIALPPTSLAPVELFEGPSNSARISLVAQATPAAQRPGLYDVRVTIDLHDIHLEQKDGRFTGSFDFSIPNPSAKGTIKTGTAAIELTDKSLAEALESGFNLVIKGAEPESGEIRVVVRDRATGIAGSVRVPVAK